MKRRDLIRHLEANGCEYLREGGRPTVYWNPKNNRTAAIPRHNEIVTLMARRICSDLDLPPPPSK